MRSQRLGFGRSDLAQTEQEFRDGDDQRIDRRGDNPVSQRQAQGRKTTISTHITTRSSKIMVKIAPAKADHSTRNGNSVIASRRCRSFGHSSNQQGPQARRALEQENPPAGRPRGMDPIGTTRGCRSTQASVSASSRSGPGKTLVVETERQQLEDDDDGAEPEKTAPGKPRCGGWRSARSFQPLLCTQARGLIGGAVWAACRAAARSPRAAARGGADHAARIVQRRARMAAHHAQEPQPRQIGGEPRTQAPVVVSTT